MSHQSHQQEEDKSPRSNIRFALVDLSGTLHVGSRAIAGAVEAMEHKLLQRKWHHHQHLKVLFLTNTTTVSRATLHRSLRDMGFASIQMDDILTSAQAAQHHVEQHGLQNPYCLVEPDMQQDLAFSASNQSTSRDGSSAEQQQQQQQQGDGDEQYDSVLVGLSPSNFYYETLNRAFRILQRHPPHRATTESSLEQSKTSSSLQQQQQQQQEHRLLCFHRSKYVRSEDGLLSLGPGGFVACLEHATGHEALVLGKPSPVFFRAALDKLGVCSKQDLQDCVMVGDDVMNDLEGARKVGVGHVILVQTGKYVEGDEAKFKDSNGRGVVVVPSIVEAVDYILEHAAGDDAEE